MLARLSVPCRGVWGHTLHAPEDLPFEVSALPEITQEVALGEVPSIEDLGLVAPEPGLRAALAFEGGEAEATTRLRRYVCLGAGSAEDVQGDAQRDDRRRLLVEALARLPLARLPLAAAGLRAR